MTSHSGLRFVTTVCLLSFAVCLVQRPPSRADSGKSTLQNCTFLT